MAASGAPDCTVWRRDRSRAFALFSERGSRRACLDRSPVACTACSTMDVLAGIVLAASPWIFGFADEGTAAWLPHLVFGLGLLAAGLMTQRERETARTSTRARTAQRT